MLLKSMSLFLFTLSGGNQDPHQC